MSDDRHQDPMIALKARNQGMDSGVFCKVCTRERSRLDAQWGGDRCRGCRRKDAKKTRAHYERRSQSMIAPGARALEDIDDIVTYCERYVDRRFPYIDEREDYVNEAVAIAYKLHRDKWRRDLQPSFSKYLSTLLWQRLKDHWRTDIRQQGRGRRRQEGGFEATPVASLDELRDRKIEIGDDEGGIAA